jgi:hypothetical protein
MAAGVDLNLRCILRNDDPREPVVQILVGGSDLVTGVEAADGFIGFDPADLLDSGALVPSDPPRRVALYRCSCGVAGCGCVAMVIEHRGETVVWSDARDYTGVYVRPVTDHNPTSGGRSLALADLHFDAAQYLSEVERASTDRSWESGIRRTARRLKAALAEQREEFRARGYLLGWVHPSYRAEGAIDVSFIGPSGQILVSLMPAPTLDPDIAEMVAVLTGDVRRWPVSHRTPMTAEQVASAFNPEERPTAPIELG